jgi:hypothetical protein
MADILLIEPGYANKYPPLGIMKISYFHKYILGDYVRFAKGELPIAFKDKKWDRVYVTTLFTFEWEKTKKAIEYAISVVKDPTQVYTGGILATLMPELIAETFPMIKNNTGLLNRTGTLGLKGEECIDTMTPDYGILDDIADEYVYPAHDAYFTYMTRGCGMRCQFCAVQTLEPNYIPYLSITENITRIDEKFGPKKDLLLMDNNILRSPDFDKIIDEIKALGFQKGATYTNPKTGKQVQRFVDFNQGLDAFLLTPHKAKRLGELALRPARIAFDHIEDVEAYKTAIRLCAESGITHMSNYLLYNGDDFKGKGHSYHADTPEDLYERMRISMDLCEKLNSELDHTTAIFSFPMRYIPLSDLKRGYVGTNWNHKYLRALQRMLIPTQGKGVSSRSFFEADFGKSPKEFVQFLAMPEEHLGWRGHFAIRKNETTEEAAKRKVIWNENQQYLREWTRLFEQLGSTKDEFINAIGDNNYTIEQFLILTNDLHKRLFIHYLTIPMLLKSLNIENKIEKDFIVNYISNEFPLMYERMVRYIRNGRIPYSLIEGAYKTYGKKLVIDVISEIEFESSEPPFVINNLSKIQAKTGFYSFNYDLIKYAYLYFDAGILNVSEKIKLISAIKQLDEREMRELLCAKLDDFKQKLIEKVNAENAGIEYVLEQIESTLSNMHKQLSFFEET